MPEIDMVDAIPVKGPAGEGAVVDPTTIKVFEETLKVEKRLVESDRAKVHIAVSEHDETIETLLMRQDLAIERVSLGTVVTTAPLVRREGDVLIVPVMEEIVVVEKRLVLKEELHIRIRETSELDTQVVRLRREHANIDHTGPGASLPSQTIKEI